MRTLANLLFHVPVSHGPLPLLIGAGALASLVAFVRRHRGGLRLRVLLAWFGAALAGITAIGMAVGIENRVGSSFPRSFFVWGSLPVFGLAVTADAWRHGQRRVLAWGLLGAVLFGLFGAAEVNAHYAYVPTVGDLLGAPMRDQVPAERPEHVRLAAAHPGLSAAPTATPTDLLPFDAADVRARPDRGVLVEVRMPGTVSHFAARPGFVWLPPAYLHDPNAPLPVVMLLAGVPGDPSNMARAAGAPAIADAYAAAHGGTAPILVFPDHNGGFFRDTECVDGPRGTAETYLTADVPAFVHAAIPSTVSSPWAVIGYSEGGTCAVTLTLRHPGLFRAFVDIAGDPAPNAARGPRAGALTLSRLYGNDLRAWQQHDPRRILLQHPPVGVAGWFVVGNGDRAPLSAAQTLSTEARAAGLDISFLEMRGGHNFDTVRHALATTFPPVADRLLTTAGARPAS
ncbi:MAG TPA: alpha/beta hydrolase-fold protein [Angustibacter sp.]|nr:alpha/beta hydrolase-fold protein [Angustibacter sp.]